MRGSVGSIGPTDMPQNDPPLHSISSNGEIEQLITTLHPHPLAGPVYSEKKDGFLKDPTQTENRTFRPSETSSVDQTPFDEPPCTTTVIQNFKIVRERNDRRKHTKHHDPWADNRIEHEKTLAELRRWSRSLAPGFLNHVKTKYRNEPGRRKLRPSKERLVKLALHYFPLRGDIRIRIIDFGHGFSECHEANSLKEVEGYIKNKPSNIDVRWIHAPLGQGIAHSSLEDIFLNVRGRRNASVYGKNRSWPYQEVEVLNFRKRDEYNALRDVFTMLCNTNFSANRELHEELNELSRKSLEGTELLEDFGWRSEHLNETTGYWELVASDIPYHLTQLSALETGHGPKDGLKPLTAQHVKQTLWHHSFYKDVQLVRNMFRCFHREDGVLLTMSAAAGVDFLDKDLHHYMSYSRQKREESEEATVLGFLFKRFAQTGTQDWNKRTVEWFLVYILTEFAVTPHTIRQGRNAVMLSSAYQIEVEKLKLRRYERMQKNESVELVKEYNTCSDELSSISLVLKGKTAMLELLRENVEKDESLMEDNSPRTSACETALERIDWALREVKGQHNTYSSLLEDLRLATQALFQLRSIEQNELAIKVDNQNKAILAFTGVTIVFLPLTFFTGYFGMNLRGIQNTKRDESWFWKVCGVVAFLIITFSMMYAFRHRLKKYYKRILLKTQPIENLLP